MLTETPAELYFEEGSIFRKVINTTGNWIFEKRTGGGEPVLSRVFFRFSERKKF